MKKLTKCTSFGDNMSQNNLLSSHITVSSILLCPALYCVQHITVSSTLLCPTKYCVHTYPKGLLFPFTFQCAAVISCCSCQAPQFYIGAYKCLFPILSWYSLLCNIQKFLIRYMNYSVDHPNVTIS